MPLDKISQEYIESFLAFLQQGEAAADISLKKYPALPIYFENPLGFLNKTIRRLSRLTPYPRPVLECLLFYSKSLSTIHVAMDVAYKGHYAESMALTRMVYESFTRIVFISTYPERDSEAFDFNTFKIRHVEQLMKYDLYDLYKMLSTNAHSHKVDVVKELNEILQHQAAITFGSVFDDEVFTSCYNLILFFLWALVAIIPNVFPQLHGDSDWFREHQFMEVEVGRWFRGHNKDFWHQAVTQVELAKLCIGNNRNK